MRLPNVKILLCWPSRMQIYGPVENHTFLEQFVSRGYQDIFPIWGYQDIFSNLGVPGHFCNLGVPGHFSNLGVPGHFFQSGGTRTFFSTLYGSLWLGKNKGSIMKYAESGGQP